MTATSASGWVRWGEWPAPVIVSVAMPARAATARGVRRSQSGLVSPVVIRIGRDLRERVEVERRPVRVPAEVDERLRVANRRVPEGLGKPFPRAGPEHGLLEEPPRAAGDVAGRELILDAREQRLHGPVGDEAEQGRLVGEHAAHELGPADREPERDRGAVGGADEVRGAEPSASISSARSSSSRRRGAGPPYSLRL